MALGHLKSAARYYFDRNVKDLQVEESALLVGLLKAPTTYSPIRNPHRAIKRRNQVLLNMTKMGRLSRTTYTRLNGREIRLQRRQQAETYGLAPYFVEHIRQRLNREFGSSLYRDGFTVHTTLNSQLQQIAEKHFEIEIGKVQARVDQYLAEQDSAKAVVDSNAIVQAAFVAMDPGTGRVLAMIGGRDNTVNGAFNRAIQAKRQTGSSFKPFVYAAALEAGYSPSDIIEDGPITIRIPGGKNWSPKNYTRRFYGNVTLETALKNSLNTATVRLQEIVGRDAVRRVASDFGIVSNLTTSPSLALGASEATLLELTGAYAGIRNGGTSVAPYGLVELSIKGDDQPLMGQLGGLGQRVISPRAAGQLIYMMQQVIDSGTGKRAKLGSRPAAGKTGTTSSYRDAWFVGFTEQYVVGVWMGYDDNTPLKGVTGGGLPAEIWQAVMTDIHEGLPELPLSTVSPDGSGVIMSQGNSTPKVVTSGSADDPLAAALAGVMNSVEGSSQQRGRIIGAAPTEVGGSAPQTPGSSTSANSDDALSRALNGILGGN